MRLDRDSGVEWRLARNTHHDVHVRADGTILVPAHRYRTEGVPACSGLIQPPYYEDTVLFVSPGGGVTREVSVLEALCRSPYKGLFSVIGTESGAWRGRIEADDLLHLNNVDAVTAEQAQVLPFAREGDLLLSLRNLNAVGFLDPAAGRFRWVLTGPFVRQHDPDLLPDGSLLLFDNRGAVDGSGAERSQVLQVDPATQAVTWSYGGADADADPPLWSEKMGNQQLLPNGNVLVTESWGGRVLEVTRDPEPVLAWAYVNGLPPAEDGGKPRVGLVSQAVRFRPEELPFLAEPTEGSVSSPGTRPAGPRAG